MRQLRIVKAIKPKCMKMRPQNHEAKDENEAINSEAKNKNEDLKYGLEAMLSSRPTSLEMICV